MSTLQQIGDTVINQSINQSFLSSAVSAFWVIFFSELGDRTFLTTFLFSSTINQSNNQPTNQSINQSTYRSLLNKQSLIILLATNTAAALLALISSILGSLSTHLISQSINQSVHFIASLACVLFGCHMIYEAATDQSISQIAHDDNQSINKVVNDDNQSVNQPINQSINQSNQQSLTYLFIQSFTAAILTESFDHGQLSFFMLSTNQSINQFGVMIGGIFAHILCTTVAAIGGKWFASINQSINQSDARRIQKLIRYAAGAIFVGMAMNQMMSID